MQEAQNRKDGFFLLRIFGALTPGFTSFAYTPPGYALQQITAAAADAALPLMLDRLKQADRIQDAYMPIQAIIVPIQADKRRECRQDRHQEGRRQKATDRRQAGNIAKHENRLHRLFYAVRLTDAARILDADRDTINRQRMQKQTEARQRIAAEYPMPNNCPA